jgi:hypothetical protein
MEEILPQYREITLAWATLLLHASGHDIGIVTLTGEWLKFK